jgi:hypothetical protein
MCTRPPRCWPDLAYSSPWCRSMSLVSPPYGHGTGTRHGLLREGPRTLAATGNQVRLAVASSRVVLTGVVESIDHFINVRLDGGGIIGVAPWGGPVSAIRYARAVAQARRDGNPDYCPEWSLAGRLQVGQRVELVKTERSLGWVRSAGTRRNGGSSSTRTQATEPRGSTRPASRTTSTPPGPVKWRSQDVFDL